MHYVLQGKIAKAHPYQLDKSLTVEGAGAEAQAVGKAIEEVKKHSELKDNPHNVTAKQIGLENVDNTSDMDKPVSTAQREALNALQEAVAYAQQAADNGCASAAKAQDKAVLARADADNAKATAEEAKTDAANAQTRADDAYTLARTKCSVQNIALRLLSSNWNDNMKLVFVEGIEETDHVFITPQPSCRDEYCRCGVCGYEVTSTGIRFKCEEVPTVDLKVDCFIFREGYTKNT